MSSESKPFRFRRGLGNGYAEGYKEIHRQQSHEEPRAAMQGPPQPVKGGKRLLPVPDFRKGEYEAGRGEDPTFALQHEKD